MKIIRGCEGACSCIVSMVIKACKSGLLLLIPSLL